MKPSALCLTAASLALCSTFTEASLADRSRIVKARDGPHRDNGRAIEGPKYRNSRWSNARDSLVNRKADERRAASQRQQQSDTKTQLKSQPLGKADDMSGGKIGAESTDRDLGQLTGCCSNYQSYYAADMCGLYGQDCEEGGGSGDNGSGDEDCSMEGLSFVGISFSVNTANGNPYSYQNCDQFPMENIIDRDYDYVMSMDEDGWLVGGGYKSFDYSGKMPYIDSSHTELVRIGSMDPDRGGTSIEQVYSAMSEISFTPFSVFPEYLKGGGGHQSNDNDDGDQETPSGDVTLVVSIVESYDDNDSYSDYDSFLDQLFQAMSDVGGGPCMDDHDTDPHVSMARGVKFHSSYHSENYMYAANLEVAVWQSMYPNGVVIGSPRYASFPPGTRNQKSYIGYGSLYFFFDRANITKVFAASRTLTDDESYYSTLYSGSDTSGFYSDTTEIDFSYGSGSGDQAEWEHNPYAWKATSAMHDMTDGWDLPPNCEQEGETFLGIPLSRQSDSNMQSTSTFQTQFDLDNFIDKNYTYVSNFGTNHGWLIGESIGNAVGSIVDKDTAHIPIFYTGTTNQNMGGISLSNLIKVVQTIQFGNLYIKPAFVFVDDNGHLKLQFEADSNSAMGYLYDNLCKQLGIMWNYNSPENNYGLYTNCAMHAAGDRAAYGCGPDNSNSGGFCPQMTIAYSVNFNSGDHAAAYLTMANDYVDYWRSLYPTGVAVGTSSFCSDGGCLGLFLNRYDLYSVFKPDLGGTWVEYNGASMAPTHSPAPTWYGGCSEPHNQHLDKCFQRRSRPTRSTAVAWDSLGQVGQASVFLVTFMATTLAFSLFVSRARKKRRKGESYLGFFLRDTFKLKKKKRKKRSSRKKRTLYRKLKGLDKDLEKSMLDDKSRRSRSSRSRSRHSRSKSKSSRSKSGGGSKSRSKSRSKRLEAQTVASSGASRRPSKSRSKSASRRSGGIV
uniref:Subtilisin n=1 Tax=Chaetoceros debilis TaxID=122233 RepID=A0A7S3Q3K8_9STRA|mmetsp:Transcript_16954/g.24913  ORF Transcript_16954/g.24913 Transcript_16954/m.24913 type:complete len:949 (-) Transcript_16954:157-3003(-)